MSSAEIVASSAEFSMSKMFVGINKKSKTQLISVPIGRFPLRLISIYVDWSAERRPAERVRSERKSTRITIRYKK